MPFTKKQFHIPVPTRILPLLQKLLTISEKEAKRMVDRGRVACNGIRITKKGVEVKGELTLLCFESGIALSDPIFTHKDFALFDKASGVLVHPNKMLPEHTLLDDVKAHFGNEANVLHRIDKETSGLVLISRNKRSEKHFKEYFEHKYIDKHYLVFVHGHLKTPQEINAPLVKQTSRATKHHPIAPDGKPSCTHLEPLKYFPEHHITLIRAIPITGRTHQIRIHCMHAGHGIVGEPFYGQDDQFMDAYLDGKLSSHERITVTGAKRLMLHAQQLGFEYEGERFEIVSKTPFGEEEYLKYQLNI